MKINIPRFYRRHMRLVPGLKSYVIASILLLAAGLTITFLTWHNDRQQANIDRRNQENIQSNAVREDLNNRLQVYEQMLRGAAGLVTTTNQVNQAQWDNFIRQFENQKLYPGVSGIGFVQYVKDGQTDAYLQNVAANGFGNVTIQPAGNRPEYALLTLSSPLTEDAKKVVGRDILTNPERKQTIESARDNATAKLTGKVVLVSDTIKPTQNNNSFVMYVPVYAGGVTPSNIEERRNKIIGFVYAGFRSENFFSNAVPKNDMKPYAAYKVFDGTRHDNNNLLYKSADYDSNTKRGESPLFAVDVFGHQWALQFAGPDQSEINGSNNPWLIALIGTVISFAVAAILFMVMFTRARDIVYAKQSETQQAKDDLLSLASHQLRTPATAVKQYLGMILEGYSGKVTKNLVPALQKAYISNERQLDIINQILYVAKADAGRLSINRSTFDLQLLINDIGLELEDTLQAKDQQLQIEHGRKQLNISADESCIRMVVENLISNASKYSHENATITVSNGIRGDSIFIAIKDQGVGIAEDDFDKLFKKFSRIDNELSLQVGGSGIGLYIDKVLIELHGGTIKVESKPGHGSTFTIILPKKVANNLTDGNNKNGSI